MPASIVSSGEIASWQRARGERDLFRRAGGRIGHAERARERCIERRIAGAGIEHHGAECVTCGADEARLEQHDAVEILESQHFGAARPRAGRSSDRRRALGRGSRVGRGLRFGRNAAEP
jgi:hypothetical protein